MKIKQLAFLEKKKWSILNIKPTSSFQLTSEQKSMLNNYLSETPTVLPNLPKQRKPYNEYKSQINFQHT